MLGTKSACEPTPATGWKPKCKAGWTRRNTFLTYSIGDCDENRLVSVRHPTSDAIRLYTCLGIVVAEVEPCLYTSVSQKTVLVGTTANDEEILY